MKLRVNSSYIFNLDFKRVLICKKKNDSRSDNERTSKRLLSIIGSISKTLGKRFGSLRSLMRSTNKIWRHFGGNN
jgi:hypothetical protein